MVSPAPGMLPRYITDTTQCLHGCTHPPSFIHRPRNRNLSAPNQDSTEIKVATIVSHDAGSGHVSGQRRPPPLGVRAQAVRFRRPAVVFYLPLRRLRRRRTVPLLLPLQPQLGLLLAVPARHFPLAVLSASLVDDGDYGGAAADATGHRLQLARLALQYQEVADRYELCLSRLADAVDEAAVLRSENTELRVANSDLARRLGMLSGKQTAAVAIADEIRRFRLGEQKAAKDRASSEKLAALPKSISVRSNDYLKKKGDEESKNPQNHHDASGGGAAEVLDVYNQGTLKTELCNKWEETAACPSGDQCQFAHGVSELRPVIRHPRYKTQVCRMVLNGEACPYGHRCHFRHSRTAAERLRRRP